MARTVVIGGGAAGIAAARTLHDAGHDVLLVEASDRLGGRAHSLPLASLIPREGGGPDWTPAFAGEHVDAGCGWLHSAQRNPWTSIAEATGFTVDRSDANWRTQWRDLGFSPEDQASSSVAYQAWNTRAVAALEGADRPLSDFIDAHDKWRPKIDAISGYANGANLTQVSLHDWAAYEDASTDDNWTVRQGYGTLVASHAAGLNIRLSTPVTRIDHSGRHLKLDTTAGTIEADHVIVCVPTTVLARSQIVFDPPLPDKHAAAADLPLGLADKVFLHVDRPEWTTNAHLIGDPYSACTASHRLSPFGWPIVESFFGGDCADMLEDGDAAQFAIDELVGLLGSDWHKRFTPLATTRWRHERYISGSYSHALVGCAGQRAVLAASVDGRIHFAGEACHAFDFSTAHGAYETGVTAARAVIGEASTIA
ncbi:monoamine oxidase [Sphingomonas sp. PP-CE-3A-406]|uniref:flavin monoamine oxidase family protein n=1 Tax=Sphingomonas sp. PP-CE-3A-406 TaxID=2135659 RepID=UPI000EF94F4A|nr:NAD(P)/FAD-dependent oxidoreductase [Sphingomonas sp. PP-CE-3A-406]RMB55395.1 monoamine oxidase [Sphingomonas sp. PP-CE-3A-406]